MASISFRETLRGKYGTHFPIQKLILSDRAIIQPSSRGLSSRGLEEERPLERNWPARAISEISDEITAFSTHFLAGCFQMCRNKQPNSLFSFLQLLFRLQKFSRYFPPTPSKES